VLPSNPVLYRNGDSDLRYRPSSELYYLTGWREPESVLVLCGHAGEERSVLFVRKRDPERERWDGPRAGPEEARDWTGVDAAHPLEELEARLPALLAGAGRIHFRLGTDPRVQRLVEEALRHARFRGMRTGAGPKGVADPGVVLDELRLRKDPGEVAAIREAVALTVLGIREGLARAGPGVGEWEVEAAVEAAYRREGGEGPAFGTIVGSGPNGCVLHYRENGRRARSGELLLLDTGAERAFYAGDLTRTVPVSGRFTPEQRDLYSVVEGARAAAVLAVRPGVSLQDVHRTAVEELTRGLLSLGILSGDLPALLEGKAHRPWYPHHTSHWLGLEVHDPGAHVTEGAPRPLEPGMVLTVEPGLYIPPGSEGGAAPFAGLGVRIEDDVLVTPGGHEVLSADLPTAPGEVEGLVGG